MGIAYSDESIGHDKDNYEEERLKAGFLLDQDHSCDLVHLVTPGPDSVCFRAYVDHWKHPTRQPLVDTNAVDSAFIKVVPLDAHRNHHKTRDVKATNDFTIFTVDWHMRLMRERHVAREWQAAEKTGELKLPKDTLLVVPRLFDFVDENEEAKPSILVYEDLIAAGFETQTPVKFISIDDGVAVVCALADLQAGLWQIWSR